MLILDGADVAGLVLADGCGNGSEKRQADPAEFGAVEQEAAGQDVGRGDIGLELRQIAEAPYGSAVAAARQTANDVFIVFAINRVVEPDLSLL